MFRTHGYVVTPLLTASETEKLRQIHDEFNPEVPRDYYATIAHPDSDHKRQVSAAIDVIVQEKVLALLAGYRCIASAFITKRGYTTQGTVGIHQDYTFVNQSKHTGVHVWIPLIDVDENNSCMSVYPGTHSLVNHVSGLPGQSNSHPSPYDSVRDVLAEKCKVTVPMEAGSALFFNERTLHSSDENKTAQPRVVVNCAYVPATEPMYLYCPSQEAGNKLDVLAVKDIANLQLVPGQAIPYPYSSNYEQIGTEDYTIVPLTPDQLLPLFNEKSKLEIESQIQVKEQPAEVGQAKLATSAANARSTRFGGWLKRMFGGVE